MTFETVVAIACFTAGAIIGNVFPVNQQLEKPVQEISSRYYCEQTAEGLECEAIKLPESQFTELNPSSHECDNYGLVYGLCS